MVQQRVGIEGQSQSAGPIELIRAPHAHRVHDGKVAIENGSLPVSALERLEDVVDLALPANAGCNRDGPTFPIRVRDDADQQLFIHHLPTVQAIVRWQARQHSGENRPESRVGSRNQRRR